ncbi:hypothetical protein ElyMa_005318100 [Elysia marginata]|uniref:Uncharacterized protein n=1 Tax=Elysia marginata TaxID=1093978 RepID=A0AAV4K2W1_9GAST|nr:hypothetical protein ElyMa_005318100 [Elysia marginata]
MHLFQDGFKEDTDVRNVVLQETSQGPMDRKEKQKKNYTNGRCRRKTVVTAYEAETLVCWTHHKRQLGTFATTIPRGENRREEGTGKDKKDLDGRCKGMVRVDKLWRYETEGLEREEWRDMVANLRTEDSTSLKKKLFKVESVKKIAN